MGVRVGSAFYKADNENGMLGAIRNVPSFTVNPGDGVGAMRSRCYNNATRLSWIALAVIVFTQWLATTRQTT
jgi:hypothetical protein